MAAVVLGAGTKLGVLKDGWMATSIHKAGHWPQQQCKMCRDQHWSPPGMDTRASEHVHTSYSSRIVCQKH